MVKVNFPVGHLPFTPSTDSYDEHLEYSHVFLAKYIGLVSAIAMDTIFRRINAPEPLPLSDFNETDCANPGMSQR